MLCSKLTLPPFTPCWLMMPFPTVQKSSYPFIFCSSHSDHNLYVPLSPLYFSLKINIHFLHNYASFTYSNIICIIWASYFFMVQVFLTLERCLVLIQHDNNLMQLFKMSNMKCRPRKSDSLVGRIQTVVL